MIKLRKRRKEKLEKITLQKVIYYANTLAAVFNTRPTPTLTAE